MNATTNPTRNYRIESRVSGAVIGDYQATDEASALDAMAQDAGYKSFADSCRVLSQDVDEAREELSVSEVR